MKYYQYFNGQCQIEKRLHSKGNMTQQENKHFNSYKEALSKVRNCAKEIASSNQVWTQSQRDNCYEKQAEQQSNADSLYESYQNELSNKISYYQQEEARHFCK